MQINAGLFISPIMISLGKKKHDGIAEHVVTRRVGKQITRVVSYRPQINEWQTGEFIMEGIGSPSTIKEYLTFGGSMKGLYGYRPTYGRFEIKKWEVVNG